MENVSHRSDDNNKQNQNPNSTNANTIIIKKRQSEKTNNLDTSKKLIVVVKNGPILDQCDADDDFKSTFARSIVYSSKLKSAQNPKLQLEAGKTAKFAGSQNGDCIVAGGFPPTRNPQISSYFPKLVLPSADCSRMQQELPVEKFVNQTKVETLEWQLKEIEKSREMYRAVMKQVLTFLERAHHSLESFTEPKKKFAHSANPKLRSSKSEHQIVGVGGDLEYHPDFTWRRPKKSPNTICNSDSTELYPPEKLSQEAFRLLRTVQSVLNTREPMLAVLEEPPEDDPDDIKFLSQLANEFPSSASSPTPISLNPKLIQPEFLPERIGSTRSLRGTSTSTVLNRKLSLQINRKSMGSGGTTQTTNTGGKVGEGGSNSSSVEDESGFSSMNSFQEVGLPVCTNNSSTELNRTEDEYYVGCEKLRCGSRKYSTLDGTGSGENNKGKNNRHHSMKVLWV